MKVIFENLIIIPVQKKFEVLGEQSLFHFWTQCKLENACTKTCRETLGAYFFNSCHQKPFPPAVDGIRFRLLKATWLVSQRCNGHHLGGSVNLCERLMNTQN